MNSRCINDQQLFSANNFAGRSVVAQRHAAFGWRIILRPEFACWLGASRLAEIFACLPNHITPGLDHSAGTLGLERPNSNEC